MASKNVAEFTTANWEQEVVQSDKPVLVDFWAPWCGPCRMVAPIVDEIAEAHKGKLKVVKMNVDENSQAPQTYGVMAIPTLILFKGGEPQEKVVGVESKAKLLDRIAKHI